MRCPDIASIYRTLSTMSSQKVLAISGSDDFFREDCTVRYIEQWKASGGEVERLTVSDFINRHDEGSLFGTKKLCCVEGGFSEKKADDVLLALRNTDDSVLLVSSEAFPQALTEYADQAGAVFSFPSIKPWDRLPLQVSWIRAYVKKRGAQIDANGATLLAKGYAQDRQGLAGELEKLVTYCFGETTITAAHVEKVGIVALQPTLWQLLDGLLAGDLKAVSQSVTEDLYDIAVLRFLKNQLEKLVIAVEEEAPSRNRSQERQLAAVRKRTLPVIISWINRLKMHEVGIRSGTEDVQEGTLLPLLLSLARSRS